MAEGVLPTGKVFALRDRLGFKPDPESTSAIRTLQKALRARDWQPEEVVNHSDRGGQYAASEYTALLDQSEIQISMSRRGNPYIKALAERFMRTLKQEEIFGNEYLDLEDARSRIGEFLKQVYNRQRLHSALRYLTPKEFERAYATRGSDGGSNLKRKTGRSVPIHSPARVSQLRGAVQSVRLSVTTLRHRSPIGFSLTSLS